MKEFFKNAYLKINLNKDVSRPHASFSSSIKGDRGLGVRELRNVMKISFYFQHLLFWFHLWKLSHTQKKSSSLGSKTSHLKFFLERVCTSFIGLLSSRSKTTHPGTALALTLQSYCWIVLLMTVIIPPFMWEKRMQKWKYINLEYLHLQESMSNIFLERDKRDGHILLSFLCSGSWNSDFVLL